MIRVMDMMGMMGGGLEVGQVSGHGIDEEPDDGPSILGLLADDVGE